MKKVLAVLVPLLMVGSVAFVLHQRTDKPRTASSRNASDRDELTELRREVGTLRGEVRASAMQRQLTDATVQRAEPAAEATTSPPAEEAEEQVSPEEAQARTEAHIAQIAQAFQAEVADRQWSSKVESEIGAVLKDQVKLNAKSVECRARTCRLELEGNDAAAQAKGLPVIANRMGPTLPTAMGHVESDGRGGTNMVLYLYRDGA
jgi:hypothetical protein